MVAVTLNQVPHGEYFVVLQDNGDFLVRTADLEEMGFRRMVGEIHPVEGEEYLAIRSIPGTRYRFHEETLTLDIDTDPAYLPKSVLDLMPPRREGVYCPQDSSLFFNYGVAYSAGGESLAYEGFNLTTELGFRHRELLFLTNSVYTDTPDDRKFVRLMTNLTWDRRDRLQRLVAGDFFAFSGDLGSQVNLEGISFSKVYRIDPYFIENPLFDFTGLLPLPSEVELYLDGTRLKSESFRPGTFEIQNFRSIGGAQKVEILIRDSLGRERRIVSPFYFTDRLLRKGLHEYSYNLGLLREDFGIASNRYGGLAFSAFHHYGVNDRLNLGGRAEAGKGLYNLGIESLFKVGSLGLVALQLAGSTAKEGSGLAALASYEFQSRRFNARFGVQGYSEDYLTIAREQTETRDKYLARAGVGYVVPVFGSVSLDASVAADYDGESSQTLTATYARKIWSRLYLNAMYRHSEVDQTNDEVFVNFNYYFGANRSLALTFIGDRESTSQRLEVSQDVPVGEGWGWRAALERTARDASESYLINPALQYNGPYGIYRGEFSYGQSDEATREDLRLAVSGGVVRVGGAFALTRPVTDSFGLVKVGDQEGVRVYVNNQEIGTTDVNGQVIVPALSSYYENQVSIEDQDIPIDFLMPQIRQVISPPLRSGSCLNFPLYRYQAVTGIILEEGPEGRAPLVNADLTLQVGQNSIPFYTSDRGEFYFDNTQADFDPARIQGCGALDETDASFLNAGEYSVSGTQKDRTFSIKLVIPASHEPVIDLGEILVPPLVNPGEN